MRVKADINIVVTRHESMFETCQHLKTYPNPYSDDVIYPYSPAHCGKSPAGVSYLCASLSW